MLSNIFLGSRVSGTDSKAMLLALHTTLSQKACRLWLSWNGHMKSLISSTIGLIERDINQDEQLQAKWDTMIRKSLQDWSRIVGQESIVVEIDDEYSAVQDNLETLIEQEEDEEIDNEVTRLYEGAEFIFD